MIARGLSLYFEGGDLPFRALLALSCKNLQLPVDFSLSTKASLAVQACRLEWPEDRKGARYYWTAEAVEGDGLLNSCFYFSN